MKDHRTADEVIVGIFGPPPSDCAHGRDAVTSWRGLTASGQLPAHTGVTLVPVNRMPTGDPLYIVTVTISLDSRAPSRSHFSSGRTRQIFPTPRDGPFLLKRQVPGRKFMIASRTLTKSGVASHRRRDQQR